MSLTEFEAAPADVQAFFFEKIRRQSERDHRVSRAVTIVHGVTPRGYAVGPDPDEPLVRWGPRWRRRAQVIQGREERGWKPDDFAAQRDRLSAIEAVAFVEQLTGEEPNRAGYVRCPLPDHEERTPSFRCRDVRFNCFGCGHHGSIYELAGILWDLDRYGSQFTEIHERLLEVFPHAR